ncbi:MAG TPA: NADH-quinone oxidoreductase subunit L [Ktedonobacterales bacterium]|nr:NADH-quinone oxidoreductase subunit L [Ktedonobacterales bacterium]
MDFVSYAWVIPALPLAAFIIILGVTRPLEMLARRRELAATGGHDPASAASAHGAPGDAHDTHASALTPAEHGAVHHDAGQPGAPGGPGGPEGAHDMDTLVGAHGRGGALEAPDAHAGGGHGEHGAATAPWAQAGSSVGIVAMLLAFLVALGILIQFLTTPSLQQHGAPEFNLYNWFSFGNLNYAITFHVDTLTAVMLVVVTSVSLLVHLYSVGYMAGDPGYSRFFIELALFTVSMLILVLGANFLVLFIGWELVGLSSYLLIGFWFDQAPPVDDVPYPPPAALKAFVTTRLGDFGFMIGILILFVTTGTFDFTKLNATATYTHVDQFTVTAAMILVFCGAVGKSAQFPLHVWLPDAMAGPTPVSALIHAATMVAAGVYLVARLFPLYHSVAGPQSLEVVGYVGGFTALFAATIALVQNDIKKVLAYSTISQLGYMFVGLAVGPTDGPGIFHLFTHAFFKALLFLGSGSVIHAIANQDMRKMGGLAKFMPVTAATFLIATFSISGFPGFSGFFSKDAIIGLAYDYGTTHGGNYTIYAFTIVTAFLTAFYMFRAYFMTFGGRSGSALGFWGGERAYRGETRPHGSPWVMWLPLAILAVPAAIAGLVWGGSFDNFVSGGIAPVTNVLAPFADGLTWVGIVVALGGIGLAWLMYGIEVVPATIFTGNPIGKGVYAVLAHKYYLDELYGLIIKYLVLGLASLVVLFDQYIIDGVVNGAASLVRGIGDASRRTESGGLQNYGAAIFGGALIIILLLFFAVGAIGR